MKDHEWSTIQNTIVTANMSFADVMDALTQKHRLNMQQSMSSPKYVEPQAMTQMQQCMEQNMPDQLNLEYVLDFLSKK